MSSGASRPTGGVVGGLAWARLFPEASNVSKCGKLLLCKLSLFVLLLAPEGFPAQSALGLRRSRPWWNCLLGLLLRGLGGQPISSQKEDGVVDLRSSHALWLGSGKTAPNASRGTGGAPFMHWLCSVEDASISSANCGGNVRGSLGGAQLGQGHWCDPDQRHDARKVDESVNCGTIGIAVERGPSRDCRLGECDEIQPVKLRVFARFTIRIKEQIRGSKCPCDRLCRL